MANFENKIVDLHAHGKKARVQCKAVYVRGDGDITLAIDVQKEELPLFSLIEIAAKTDANYEFSSDANIAYLTVRACFIAAIKKPLFKL